MRRDLKCILAVVCIVGTSTLGCSAPGSRTASNPFSWFSQGTTPAQEPQTQTAQTQSWPLSQTSTTTSEKESEGFSFSKMLQFAGFQKPEEAAPTVVPQSVVDLSTMINNVSAQSAQLNVNDAPEVTRQKAQSILASLQGWDNTLAASSSTGLVNGKMAETLNTWVTQLRGEAQKLVQYMPNPQSIAAIRQIGSSLSSTFANVTATINQANAASTAFMGAADRR